MCAIDAIQMAALRQSKVIMAHRLISVFVKCIKVRHCYNIVVNSYYMTHQITSLLFCTLSAMRPKCLNVKFGTCVCTSYNVGLGGSKAFCLSISITRNSFLYYRCVKLAGDWQYSDHGLQAIGLM